MKVLPSSSGFMGFRGASIHCVPARPMYIRWVHQHNATSTLYLPSWCIHGLSSIYLDACPISLSLLFQHSACMFCKRCAIFVDIDAL